MKSQIKGSMGNIYNIFEPFCKSKIISKLKYFKIRVKETVYRCTHDLGLGIWRFKDEVKLSKQIVPKKAPFWFYYLQSI